jgi:hypothetical protein
VNRKEVKMKTAATALRVFVGLDGLILIILGLLFWTGNADALIPVHMLLGIALVLALWTLAALAAFSGVSPALVALAVLWGVVVPILGLTQERLLPGDLHWLIQALHLLVGITAIALAQILAIRITGRRTSPPVRQGARRMGSVGDALD